MLNMKDCLTQIALALVLVALIPSCSRENNIKTTIVSTPQHPPVSVLEPTAIQTVSATPAPSAIPSADLFDRLPFDFNERALSSPDGSLVASTQTLTFVLYDLNGMLLGQYKSTNNRLFNSLWLADSKGILFWQGECGPHAKLPDPILFMDRQGKVRDTGLKGCNPVPSQNGMWVAAEQDDKTSDQTLIEIVSLTGGNPRTLVRDRGIDLLGWQENNVLYDDGAFIYAYPITETHPNKLSSLSPVNTLTQPIFGSSTSPDGEVLSLVLGQKQAVVLAQGKLRDAPPSGLIWTGAHETLDFTSEGEITITDMVSGEIVRHIGSNLQGMPLAVSGSWLAWQRFEDETLHLYNLDSGVDQDLGTCLACGNVMSLGKGDLVLHSVGKPEFYLLDASRLNR